MENQVKDLILCFTSIFYEALPFIVLGSIIAGVLENAVPQHWITRMVPRNRAAAIGLSCLLGLVFPMCECGIVPVMRRLLRKRLPLSCCVAYMMAGPIINPVVLLSTWVAFGAFESGWVIVVLRVGMAYVIAFNTASIVDRMHRKNGDDLLAPSARPDNKEGGEAPELPRGFRNKINAIAGTALHDFVDITVFLTLGALLSSLSRLVFSLDQIGDWSVAHPVWSILVMMGLAIVLCLCSEADAFVAASFSKMPPAPKLAFLVLGPMLDFKLFMLFTRVFRQKLIWTIIICVVTQTFAYSLLVHYFVSATVGTG